MANPIVMGDASSGPTPAGPPAAGSAISTVPTVLVKNKPICVISDQTGPTAPMVTPAAIVKAKNKPVVLMPMTATGANVTATSVTVNIK